MFFFYWCFRPGGDCPLPPQQSVPMLEPPLHIQPSDENALTLCFDHPACCSSRLVGGKGCQLALLTHMKDKVCFDRIYPYLYFNAIAQLF